MKIQSKYNLLYLTIFGIAMGFLEAIVVVYIRQLYYPNGFKFPMVFITGKILSAELLREFCTIVMLTSISFIAGKTPLQRLSCFIFSFAIWDIFYYAGLKIVLNWPPSLLTWDILFLIPVAWLGPVLAPILCSITMIILAITLLYIQDKKLNFKLKSLESGFIILGAFLILITFLWDFSKILFTHNLLSKFFDLANNDKFLNLLSAYVPVYYNWPLFIIGIGFIYLSLFIIVKRHFSRENFKQEKKVQNESDGIKENH